MTSSGDKRIGGTAVEGAKPLYEVVFDKHDGEMKHDRTGVNQPPAFPYKADHAIVEGSRRDALAAWITSPDNEYFASSYVNSLWGYMMGTGIIEPLDDIAPGTRRATPSCSITSREIHRRRFQRPRDASLHHTLAHLPALRATERVERG